MLLRKEVSSSKCCRRVPEDPPLQNSCYLPGICIVHLYMENSQGTQIRCAWVIFYFSAWSSAFPFCGQELFPSSGFYAKVMSRGKQFQYSWAKLFRKQVQDSYLPLMWEYLEHEGKFSAASGVSFDTSRNLVVESFFQFKYSFLHSDGLDITKKSFCTPLPVNGRGVFKRLKRSSQPSSFSQLTSWKSFYQGLFDGEKVDANHWGCVLPYNGSTFCDPKNFRTYAFAIGYPSHAHHKFCF